MEQTVKELSSVFGYAIGEQIARSLPTLSCDSLQSTNIIQVTWGEANALYRLEDKWYKNHKLIDKGADDPNWIRLQEERRKLEAKYIPKTHEWLYFGQFPDGMDIELFKNGVVTAMWNSDYSHYSCDVNDVEIIVEKHVFDGSGMEKFMEKHNIDLTEPHITYETIIKLKYSK